MLRIGYASGVRRAVSGTPARACNSRYIEQWQASCVKDEAFYESNAAERNYFYSIDLQGRLFLEDTMPKNIATSLKVRRRAKERLQCHCHRQFRRETD